jgi:hypothetical protein
VTTEYSPTSPPEIVKLEAEENLNREDARELHKTREKLLEQQGAIAKLEAFYDEVKNQWCDLVLRNILGGTLHTEDWAAFEVDEAKVKPEFEGTFVDLGAF